MQGIIETMKKKGYKITPQRRAVIMAFMECGQFPTAQQILDCVKKTAPDVSLDTVYRNLNLLVELGVVNEINTRSRGGNVFEIVTEGHHHHLICMSCGITKCLDFCPVTQHDIEKASEGGFSVLSHSLDFYGYCPACQAAG